MVQVESLQVAKPEKVVQRVIVHVSTVECQIHELNRLGDMGQSVAGNRRVIEVEPFKARQGGKRSQPFVADTRARKINMLEPRQAGKMAQALVREPAVAHVERFECAQLPDDLKSFVTDIRAGQVKVD